MRYILIFLICMLAIFLRFSHLDSYGLCGDEKNSFFSSQFVAIEGANQADVFYKKNNPYFTPAQFWKPKTTADFYDAIARCDNGSSAFHAYLLHIWTNVFGNSDGSARALSAFFGLLFIGLIYWFVKIHFKSQNLALGVVALVAIEPLFVGWSHIVRTYTTSFFFCLLATHLLLLIFKKEQQNQRPVMLYLWYGLCAFVCLMCHYANITLFAIHGLLVLCFVRQLRAWVGLGLAMVIPAVGSWWWIILGGGHSARKFMSDSAIIYTQMAKDSPSIGVLALTNPKTVIVQLLPIISNHFIFTNGLYDVLSGNKNLIISILVAIVSIVLYQFKLKNVVKYSLIYGLFAAAFLVYSTAKIEFSIFSVSLLMAVIFVKGFFEESPDNKRLLTMFLMLTILPIMLLVVYAYQDGNTFRIQQKYAGYGLIYGLILVGFSIKYLLNYDNFVKYPIAVLLLLQMAFVFQTNLNIINDNAPRYLFNSKPRAANPHRLVATKIMAQYTPADTVLYPSFMAGENFKYGIALPSYSIKDAQLVNFYLPKNATIQQRINSKESNKVFLKKANGQLVELFDFEAATYRY
jgi:uncharacterized membrane protein